MKIYTPLSFTKIFFTCIFSFYSFFSNAQNDNRINSNKGTLIRITPRLVDIGRNISSAIFKKTRDINGLVGMENDDDVKIHEHYPSKNANRPDRAIQSSGTNPQPAVLTGTVISNFTGLGFTNVAPSDNNMAAGPNHVIQMINNSTSSYFKIWNKAGTQVQAQTILSSLTGVTGDGDPIVIYDQLADRFILTEFGESAGVTTYPNTLIMAISVTADPTGSWKIYSFPNSGFFGDYPKFSVWHNAYYATTNDFNSTGTAYFGSTVYAFDRTAMLAGASTATVVSKRFIDNDGGRYYSMAPVSLEGSVPSTQSGLFAFIQDDAWTSNPNDVDSLFVMEFNPDFITPSASVFGAPVAIETIPFNTNVPDLDQEGTSQKIQALSERLMFKVIYRNFGDHESMVCNTTVNVGSGKAGIRWWELRRPAGNWGIYQEGTFAPTTDGNNRFMGAICINAVGSIGLLYNISGVSSYPSLWFTGRSNCDPLGTMSLPETVVVNGTGANNNIRYGDYNTLTIDPANGSFWGTGQYNTTGAWSTRMVNFSLSSPNAVNFISQPSDVSICAGKIANFAVTVSASATPTYQWQVSTNGGVSFTNIGSANNATYSFTSAINQNGNKYRCVVDGGCVTNSDVATLTVNGIYISTNGQPQNTAACSGTDAVFTVVAVGSNLYYQWQMSTDGLTYNDIAGQNSISLTVPGVTPDMNNYKYRVNINGTCPGVNTLTSTVAVLTVNSPITIPAAGQPSNVVICTPEVATFTVTTTGTSPAYQWQVSTDNGTNWTDVTGATSNTFTLASPSSQMSGYKYRAIILGACTPSGIQSNSVTLTVNDPVKITTQPINVSACVESNTVFSVGATGTGIAYQWQVSSDGSTYVNLIDGPPYAGVATNTLTINNVTASLNSFKYRVITSNTNCGAVLSNSATLIANPLPLVILSGSNTNLTPATRGELSTVTNPAGIYTYQWYKDGLLVPGLTLGKSPVTVDDLGDYQVIVTDAKGCSSKKSNTVTISDAASSQLFVYPNPSSGTFQVRYYNSGSPLSSTLRTLNIYDSKGARVYSKSYTINAPYNRMDANISNAQHGVYLIQLRDINGKNIASGKVVIE